MPRAALVSIENAVATIEKFIDNFKEGKYPKYSSDIWKQMSNSLNQKWSAEIMYTNVTQNRRNIMEIACTNKGIPFISFVSKNKIIVEETALSDSISSSDNETSIYVFESDTGGLDEFEFRITSDEWRQMKAPDVNYKNKRKYPILRKDVWTNILALAIDRQMELPCAFSFKNFKICNTPESKYYMRITGFCKSKKCGNRLFCYLNEDPGDNDFNIMVKTRDTFYESHEKVERHLRGLRRQRVGEEVLNEGATNWHKRQVRENTKFGGRIPSHIPNLHTLNMAKVEHSHRKLGVKSSDGKDLVKTIEEMNRSAPYYGFIHEIKRDKFYVAFSTPEQLHAYKQYCRTTKNVSSVSIDGTGSIAKPILRDDGSLSGHIFLYSVTINFNKTTLSVYDMLTESQDTDVIWWWLKRWEKVGAPKPRQAVCDSSRALINGISLAFNFQTVKAYIDTCFLYATGNPEYLHRSPIYTYLRLDVAHLMIMVRKWDCFKHMRHKVVCQFYLYCVGLMIDCKILQQFQEIFQLTCIIGLNEFQDSVIQDTGRSVLYARKTLEKIIANRKFNLNSEHPNPNCDDEIFCSEDNEDKTSIDNSRIQKYINNIRKTATIVKDEGLEPNPFYFVDFIDRFMPLAYEFPLWTAVAIPHVAEHALTAFVEGHFNNVKHRILKNYSGPLRVDKLLKLILNDYSGNATLFTSKLKVFNQNEGPCVSPLFKKQKVISLQQTDNILQQLDIQSSISKVLGREKSINSTKISSNIKSSPVWCDKGRCGITADNCEIILKNSVDNNDKEVFIVEDDEYKTTDFSKKQKTSPDTYQSNNIHNKPKVETRKPTGKYFKPDCNITHRNTLSGNIQKQWLLQNGNLVTSPAFIDGSHYFAHNTCGFDSILQILSANAMDDLKYKTFIQNSKNEMLQFVKYFVENGPSAVTNKERIKLLKRLFDNNIVLNYDQCLKLSSYTIDLYDFLTVIWKTCFKSEPSGWYVHQCPNCKDYYTPAIILQVDHKIILQDGFGALQKSYHNDWHQRLCVKNCSKYCQTKLTTYNTQVFIELDVRPNIESSNGICGKLRDFPTYLDLGGHPYRLAGVIARLPGHYIAYCRRINNRWEMCNDLKSKIVYVHPNTSVEPHSVIYSKVFPIDEEGHGNSIQVLENLEQNLIIPAAVDPITLLNKTKNKEIESIDNYKYSSTYLTESFTSTDHRNVTFPTTVPLDDSDTIAKDNWRNK